MRPLRPFWPRPIRTLRVGCVGGRLLAPLVVMLLVLVILALLRCGRWV
jgi:hypothetical protein